MIKLAIFIIANLGAYTNQTTVPGSGWQDGAAAEVDELDEDQKDEYPGMPENLNLDGADYPDEAPGGCVEIAIPWVSGQNEEFQFCGGTLAADGPSSVFQMVNGLQGIIKTATGVLFSWIFVKQIYVVLRQG